MPVCLICPCCGTYQYNTKSIRQVGVALKNVVKVIGGFAVKEGTKAVVSTVTGLSNQTAMRAVGKVGDGIAGEIGLGMKNTQSLSSVQYKCENCGLYWQGYDSASSMTEIQQKTVLGLYQYCMTKNEEKRKSARNSNIITAIMIIADILIWNNRYTYDLERHFLWMDYSTEEYSWHYYVFWPLLVITIIRAFVYVSRYLDHIDNKEKLTQMDLPTFYNCLLEDDSCVSQYVESS